MMDIDSQELHRRMIKMEEAIPSVNMIEHERRITSMEVEFTHLATREFVKAQIENQTNELREDMKEIRDGIGLISERQQRFKGIGQALIFTIPVVISALAVLVAVFR